MSLSSEVDYRCSLVCIFVDIRDNVGVPRWFSLLSRKAARMSFSLHNDT